MRMVDNPVPNTLNFGATDQIGSAAVAIVSRSGWQDILLWPWLHAEVYGLRS